MFSTLGVDFLEKIEQFLSRYHSEGVGDPTL